MISASRTRWDEEGLPERDRANARHLARWALTWGAAFIIAIVVLGPFPGGPAATPMWAWALTLLPLVPGTMAVRAYLRYLREGDELIRRIHVEASVVGFGVGSVVSVAFALLAQLFGQWEDSGGLTFLAMWLAFSITLRRAERKYR